MKVTKELEKLITAELERIVKSSISDAETALGKIRTINKLKEEIEDLKLERKGREWEYQKKEMEVEHKVGLERKRQEFEIENAKREAIVSIREENLAADKERFEGQMKFIQDRFEKEVGYLKEILTDVLETVKNKNGHGD